LTPVRSAVGAFLLYCALTAAVFWPLVRDPAHTLIHNDDVYGNAWAMAWVVHQATRSPLELFDANSFYPRPSSFARGPGARLHRRVDLISIKLSPPLPRLVAASASS
jgi:hypothetical protein